MSYNPDAMTVIVSGDLAPEIMENLKSQLTADVLTSKEFNERENALAAQEKVEEQTKENRQAAGLEEEDENSDTGFNAPDEEEVDEVDMADTSDESAEGKGEEEESAEETTEEEAPSEDEEVTVDEEDQEEVTEEDKEVKDELNEPNAAFEHASSLGPREVGMYLRLGVDKYRRRVRRLKKELTLAQETLQMDAAQRQRLVRRLFYVKPSDTGFTSKMQTFLSTITNSDEWVALIDTDGMISADHELTRKQIENALTKAGIDMFDNVDTLADTFNQVQRAITEPADKVNNDYGQDEF